jgi:hypothetical protein
MMATQDAIERAINDAADAGIVVRTKWYQQQIAATNQFRQAK